MSVNNYESFLKLVDQIIIQRNSTYNLENGGVICLVGPSGSGKAELAKELIKDSHFARPVTTTTRKRRPNEDQDYNYISREQFEKNQDKGVFLESTVYGGEYYGATFEAVDKIVQQKRIAVMPIDICGAITIKSVFPKNSVLVFLEKGKSAVIHNILSMDCPQDEKVLRLLSIDAEYKNIDICDTIVSMNQPLDKALKQLKNSLELS
ncbi:MAG: guanylate kinase [Sphaerochaetaceae bacterium]|nr:guanylate kinase [Sphaerochaetaceae bacterium]